MWFSARDGYKKKIADIFIFQYDLYININKDINLNIYLYIYIYIITEYTCVSCYLKMIEL